MKPKVREIENEQGAIVVDDTLSEKPHSEETELISWHWDHSKGRNIKGINIINLLYCTEELSIPVGYATVKKTILQETAAGKSKRKSEQTKNEIMRQLLGHVAENGVVF